MPRHLWDADHPYYCAEGNYFSTEYHHDYGSWREFVESDSSFYSGDPNLNLLFRWDWYAADLDDDESEDTLELFFMLQRKGIFVSARITVDRNDEPEVRAWLETRAERIQRLWAPFL